MWFLAIAGVAAVVVLVGVVVGLATSDGSVSGSLKEWVSAVCRPNTYSEPNRGGMPSASRSGACIGDFNRHDESISIGIYESEKPALDDIAAMGRGYAVGHKAGEVIVFMRGYRSFSTDPAPLLPLQDYGFVLKHGM